MNHLLGLLRVRIIRGVNLAVRDVRSSDPYIVLKMGKQVMGTSFLDFFSHAHFTEIEKKLKTRVIKKNVNPEWNEDLTLYVEDPSIPVTLGVYDKDMFSADDPMGNAEFDIQPFVEAVKMSSNLGGVPNGTIIRKVMPSRQNCLAEESPIYWSDGKVIQEMVLRLRQVESGEVELRLEWVSIPGAKGL